REVPVLEHRRRYEHLGGVDPLPQDEGAEGDEATGADERHGDRSAVRSPPGAASRLDSVDQQEPAESRERDAEPVEPVRVSLEAGQQPDRHYQGDDADWDVDEEDPFPAEGVDEHPAEDGADQRRDSGDGAPHSHRRSPSIGWED